MTVHTRVAEGTSNEGDRVCRDARGKGTAYNGLHVEYIKVHGREFHGDADCTGEPP